MQGVYTKYTGRRVHGRRIEPLAPALDLASPGAASAEPRCSGGSFSGGTLNSGRAMRKALAEGRVTPAMESDPYMLAPGTRGADSAVGTADGMPAGFGWGLRRLQARAAG